MNIPPEQVAAPHDLGPPLRRRYLLGMGAVVLFVVTSATMLERTIADGQSDGVLVSLAGRQRMLSQQLAKCAILVQASGTPEVQRVWLNQQTRALAEFKTGHAAVRDRSEKSGLAGSHSPETERLFERIEPHFDRLSRLVVNPGETVTLEESVEGVLVASESYLEGMERIVDQLANESQERMLAHNKLSQLLMLAGVLLTVVVGLAACEPTVRSIRRRYASLVAKTEAVDSARRKAERVARTHEETIRFNEAILRTAADGIVVIDQSGTMLLANPAAHRMFNAQPGSLLGSDVTTLMDDYDRIHHSQYVSAYESTGRSSVISATREVVGRRHSGEKFPIDLSVAVMEWDGRRAYTGFLRDVSERAEMQTRLSQAEKLKSIGSLAAGVAHEINTPLQFINANTQFLQTAVDELLDGDAENFHKRGQLVREAIHDNLDGVNRVGAILDAMKDFSHPGQKDKHPTLLNDCVRSTTTITRNRWKDVATLDLQLSPDLPPCQAFSAEINQALLNLVVNAADAIKEAGRDSLGVITVRTWNDESNVSVAVEDDGVGVPEENLSRLFDQFFTTKSVGAGTGQGLSIVHNVAVNLHDGAITAENRPEGGVRFVMTIPIQAGREETRTEGASTTTLAEAIA